MTTRLPPPYGCHPAKVTLPLAAASTSVPHWAAKSWPRWNSPAPPVIGLTRYPNGEDLTIVVSGAPREPTEAERLMLPADWALRSCLSFPSGSPVVDTDVRLKSIFAAASADTFGWAGDAAEADAVSCCSPAARTGLVAGTVTV